MSGLRKPDEERPPICGRGRRMMDGVQMHGATMADFCLQLSTRLAMHLDLRVIDRTGVAGNFDFDLRWASEDTGAVAADGAPHVLLPNSDFSYLEGALRPFGLQLVTGKGSGDFLVIERAERPKPN
jgi:uncharacterized protein (TIGR03435 family)